MIGQTISHYRIVARLGEGGMGVVYRADDLSLGRQVAIKLLSPRVSSDPEARRRFLHEARAAASLDHSGICTVFDAGEREGHLFIVMALLDGPTLKERLEAGPVPAAEAVGIAAQVAEALEAAHRHGIVHRDIKPANIMLLPDGRAKVVDFGLAHFAGGTVLTRTGVTLGTAAYMSPEQAQGYGVDARTDVWSLGVVLYEMLGGVRPFAGDMMASVLYAVVHSEPKPLLELVPRLAPELLRIVDRALEKDRENRYGSAAGMAADLTSHLGNLTSGATGAPTLRAILRALRRPRIAVPVTIALALLLAAGGWVVHREGRIRWAHETALPRIRELILNREPGETHLPKAYALAVEAGKIIPGDPELSGLLERCSTRISFTTEPPGASIYMKEYPAPDDGWRYLGTSPLDTVRVPCGWFAWRLEKDGYDDVLALEPTFKRDLKSRNSVAPNSIQRALDPAGRIPPGMVRVMARSQDGKRIDFFIDRFEVTNAQYKAFVDSGGYRDPKYWMRGIRSGDSTVSWEQAMARFVDQTGRPGPSTWQAGSYVPGQDEYPVAGVSWYEADAYATWAGKSLPTSEHWGVARSPISSGWLSRCNFSGLGPAPVGSYRSLTRYGTYDMAGNVREWCWNATGGSRVIRGGAWDDATYLSANVSQAPALDRSPRNGLRCVLYPDTTGIGKETFGSLENNAVDFSRAKPVPDSVFQAYRDQFSYDKQDLEAKVEWRTSKPGEWIQERIVVNAAYGDEKLPMYLFLPTTGTPPYQAVVYFPGSGSVSQASSANMETYREVESYLLFLVKNGRAVLYPVYKGTFERSTPALASIVSGAPTHNYTEYLIQVVKDFRVGVDYLETRPEIDSRKIAYLGFSWGASVAPFILSTDDRVKTAVLMVGGFPRHGHPEASAINFVTRVTIPVLMLNGRYDYIFPLEERVRPMFDLLGTETADKQLRLYGTDHFVPRNEFIRETLAWLDRYLGPVR
jgi:dienelactone hydrolase